VNDAHHGIISSELFERVQRVLASKATIRGKAVKSIYVLSSIIKCGHCGHTMIGEKKKHVTGKVYIRYVCGNHLNHKQCFYNFVHKKAIEKLIFDEIMEILKTGKVDINNIMLTQSSIYSAEKDILEANFNKVKFKFQRQLEAYEAGIISIDELQQAKNRVSVEDA
jgi:site-specific DNA recombinase